MDEIQGYLKLKGNPWKIRKLELEDYARGNLAVLNEIVRNIKLHLKIVENGGVRYTEH